METKIQKSYLAGRKYGLFIGRLEGFAIAIVIMAILSIIFIPKVCAQGTGFYPRIAISQGLDVFNATRGGKTLTNGERRNPASLDYRGRILFQHSNWLEFGFGTELFPTIDYYSLFLDAGVPFATNYGDWGRFVVIPSAEAEIVWRPLPEEQLPENYVEEESLNYSFNLRLRWDEPFGAPIFFELEPKLRMRNDITQIWGPNALPNGFFDALWEGRSLYFNVGVYLQRNID